MNNKKQKINGNELNDIFLEESNSNFFSLDTKKFIKNMGNIKGL